MRRRIADFGFSVEGLSGPRNALTDVPGVRVGHCTVDEGEVQTGVTVVVPDGQLFYDKRVAGVAVFNGFGKSMGFLQVEEKGTLETPVVLAGVSSAGALYDALFRRALEEHPAICTSEGSVNPLICECNDSYLNDARRSRLGREHLDSALAAACLDFDEGSVGAGRGMSCFGLKGGIGSASRTVTVCGQTFTVGALVNANFGQISCLRLGGRLLGPELERRLAQASTGDKGSIIIILATDAPLDARQLRRLARRSFIGVGRTGSYVGDGSGDLALAFSTFSVVPHKAPEGGILTSQTLHEDFIDPFFKAAALATEESVCNALVSATATTGRAGHHRFALADLLPELDGGANSEKDGGSCIL
ncbi:MAG: S58 family peptidase [Fretibacterium sp.]|nr:S58 family peptidase [Fretibacterium sp.]